MYGFIPSNSITTKSFTSICLPEQPGQQDLSNFCFFSDALTLFGKNGWTKGGAQQADSLRIHKNSQHRFLTRFFQVRIFNFACMHASCSTARLSMTGLTRFALFFYRNPVKKEVTIEPPGLLELQGDPTNMRAKFSDPTREKSVVKLTLLWSTPGSPNPNPYYSESALSLVTFLIFFKPKFVRVFLEF